MQMHIKNAEIKGMHRVFIVNKLCVLVLLLMSFADLCYRYVICNKERF